MYRRIIKPFLDYTVSLIGGILMLPIGLLLAILIKLDSPGPAIFKHTRAGKDLRPFTLYKFRSMYTTAPANAPTNSLGKSSVHITRMGKFLRKTSLDELPQLINVLRGELSLVGPRPVLFREKLLLSEREKLGAHIAKPGITGWAQVNGRDELKPKKKARLDADYVRDMNLWMDVKCILLTAWVVVSHHGVREGHENVQRTKTNRVLYTSHTANFSKFNRPFMRWFHDHGYTVHYASDGTENILDSDEQFTISFRRNPLSTANIRAYRQLKHLIDTNDYDIIHTHTPVGSVITRLAARDARRRGTKVIYTAHGFHFFIGAPLGNWLTYFPIELYMSRHTDVLVTINREDFIWGTAGLRALKTRYIPGVGVDLTRFRPARDQAEKTRLRKKHGFNKEDFLIICVAELNKNKNQNFLIRQMIYLSAQIPNAKLLLCGVGPYEQKYLKSIQTLGVERHVKLLGYRTDVDQLYRMSDVCVSASLREGLPLNLIEAAASGLPIVASDNRGHRDIIQDSKRGHVYRINNADEYLAGVQSVYNEPITTLSMIKHNLERIQDYSIDNALLSMTEIYREAIKKI